MVLIFWQLKKGQSWAVPGDKIAEPRSIHLATNGDLLITANDSGFIRSVDNICPRLVPVPGIQKLEQQLVCEWEPAYKSGFLFESSMSPSGPWSTEVVPNESTVTLPIDGASRFYRLRATALSGGR